MFSNYPSATMASLAKAPSYSRTGFLDLPYELRLLIYGYCLPRRTLFRISSLRSEFLIPEIVTDGWNGFDSLGSELGLAKVRDEDSASEEDWEAADQGPPDDYSFPHLAHVATWVKSSRQSVLPRLLLVSRQVSDEALNVLYGDNLFKVMLHGDDQSELKRLFAQHNRRRMKEVMIILRPMGISYHPGFKMDEGTWDDIVPSLRGLRIVAEQPIEGDHYWNGQTLEEKMKEWKEWTEPIFQYLGKTLSPECEVVIDIDEREETRKLAEKYLLHGYRQVRTETGDLIFKRGAFSWESGYWDDDDGRLSSRDVYDYDSD
ncbi:hypothetical protein K458DRAFT_412487 [Lentithecium fluviatile CBS 122367]|uniref:F-box domain-containing protein n=1 Tax=Lentithecium fluviatile CBS 122367 TaxID=1168545 RepID=A0A6G1JLR5_9PLEO|nr:hypothetical protein K458DRAFT_412487 [Lentithecium fluviatile CBS 122367]